MTCAYSREILALYVEDDLPTSEALTKVETHVLRCADCRHYCEDLRKTQSFIKARFRSTQCDPVSQETLASVRRSVMSQIDAAQENAGWMVKVERFLMLGFRRQRYAVVAFAIVAIVSASLLGQIRHSGGRPSGGAAVFVAKNTLLRPAGYREWVFMGSSLGRAYNQQQTSDAMYHNVYIDPVAYREYVRSGKFPNGTIMVREMLSADTKQESGLQGLYEKDLMALEVSVKDSSRFDDGWGFFDFTESPGKVKAQADTLPQTAGCMSCHREKAATDHVFTQFYPLLRDASSSAGAI